MKKKDVNKTKKLRQKDEKLDDINILPKYKNIN